MFGLVLLFVYVFFLSCLLCICLLAMHTLICFILSLPPGNSGWLRLLFVAVPGLFCLPFCNDSILSIEMD